MADTSSHAGQPVKKKKKNKDKKKKKKNTQTPTAAGGHSTVVAKKLKKKKKKKANKIQKQNASDAAGVVKISNKKKKKKKKNSNKTKDKNKNKTKAKKTKKKKKRKQEKAKQTDSNSAANPNKKRKCDGKSDGGKKKRKRTEKVKKVAAAKSTLPVKAGEAKVAKATNTLTATAKASQPEWDAWRKSHEISITKPEIKPFFNFSEAGEVMAPDLMKVCADFAKPTPIQAQCWPVILQGHDMVGVAETGSGKTLGFLLPAVKHVLDAGGGRGSRDHYPRIMCLSPTRELAMQIQEVANDLGRHCGLTALCCYGGSPKWKQRQALNKGVDIVIGTPGRTKDLLINDHALDLSRVSAMILDEADRMLDLGFEEDVRTIIGATPAATRQTLMFSATWPREVRELATKYFRSPVRVTVGSDDLTANVRVKQIVEVVEERDRDKLLLKLLRKYHDRRNRVLVFGLYKKECGRMEYMLNRAGWKAQSIHGDKPQAARTAALAAFKDGSQPLLIATDVAARGLDIPNVEYVINYSFPLTIEDYIHRIGRTGRAGKNGVSHTFFHKGDKARSGELVNVLNDAKMPVPPALMAFGCTVKKKSHKMYGDHFRADVDMSKKGTRIVFD